MTLPRTKGDDTDMDMERESKLVQDRFARQYFTALVDSGLPIRTVRIIATQIASPRDVERFDHDA